MIWGDRVMGTFSVIDRLNALSHTLTLDMREEPTWDENSMCPMLVLSKRYIFLLWNRWLGFSAYSTGMALGVIFCSEEFSLSGQVVPDQFLSDIRRNLPAVV